MAVHLEEARQFLALSRQELERGKNEANPYLLRDAAEKAWAAVVQATNGLMESRGERVPDGHSPRRLFLSRLEKAERWGRRLRLRDRYESFYTSLHSQCFYEGHCYVDLLEEDFRWVGGFLRDIEKLADGGTPARKKGS